MIIGYIDVATSWQLGFQHPATEVICGIINFHNWVIFFLVVIGTMVSWLLFRIIIKFNSTTHPVANRFTHSTALEVTWTILPICILILIAIPSFALLYLFEEDIEPELTVKAIGHQWYWTYEYSDFSNGELKFDSYILAEDDLFLGGLRLLEVDRRLILPAHTHIRLLATSADVLHSWAVPSLGTKIDCCPGRLNQVHIYIFREGSFYGQCSEICGINHGFIPIVVDSVNPQKFLENIGGKILAELEGLDS